MMTYIYLDCVLYTVIDGNPDGGDFSTAREVWHKEVPFGKTFRYRAGGPAFAEAAREQEAIAQEVMSLRERQSSGS